MPGCALRLCRTHRRGRWRCFRRPDPQDQSGAATALTIWRGPRSRDAVEWSTRGRREHPLESCPACRLKPHWARLDSTLASHLRKMSLRKFSGATTMFFTTRDERAHGLHSYWTHRRGVGFFVFLATAWAMLCATPPAAAQTAAQKSARFVVNIAPGGIVDAVARVVAQRLPEVWGQQVVVDNRPGASGNIGGEMVARSAPDGLTWLISLDNVATVNSSLYRNSTFDAARDLAPVTMLVVSPLVMVVNPALPVRSARELVQLARTRPGEIRFATAGSGTPQHFAGVLLSSLAHIRMEHIPYKGSIAAITDVASGQVELMIPSFTSAMPLIQAKKVRALAVTSAQRLPAMPELPTVAEAGVPGYEVNFWVGMFAPVRTPADTVRAAQQAVSKVLARPDIRERLAQDVMLPVGNTPEELAQVIRTDAAKWASLIKAFNLQTD